MDSAGELVANLFERTRQPRAVPPRPQEGPADAPGPDGGEPAEDPGPDFTGPYQAFGRQQPFPLRCLVLYFNAAERRKYGKKKMPVRYEHLDSDDPAGEGFAADGQSFSFVVAGARKALRITVRGRQLERGYDLLIAQRVGWMRSADRDFGQGDGELIAALEVEPVQEGP